VRDAVHADRLYSARLHERIKISSRDPHVSADVVEGDPPLADEPPNEPHRRVQVLGRLDGREVLLRHRTPPHAA
jgi:hypothetical protein